MFILLILQSVLPFFFFLMKANILQVSVPLVQKAFPLTKDFYKTYRNLATNSTVFQRTNPCLVFFFSNVIVSCLHSEIGTAGSHHCAGSQWF